MPMLAGIPTPYLSAFTVGLSYELTICTLACPPNEASYIASLKSQFPRESNWRSNLRFMSHISLEDRTSIYGINWSFEVLHVFEGIDSHPSMKEGNAC